jgi:multidrug efflux pump subunit AcrB
VRPVEASFVTQIWREETPAIPDLEELTFASSLFSAGDPINIELQASSIETLERAAEDLKAKLAEYPGVFDISDSFRSGKDEIQLDILPAAQNLGVTLDDLSRQVRQAFYGAEAQRIQRGRDDVKVMIRYPASERRSLADLEHMRVRTANGGEVPFYAVAQVSKGRGFSTIKRSDRQRVISVTADIDRTEGNANEVIANLQTGFMKELAAKHHGLTYRLEGEQREQQKAMTALKRNYLLAMALVYALLAIPLRSYVQPLIIMAVIPFGLVGALAGHFFMRLFMPMNLSMMSIFGVVALSGVVVNDSLVLVHYVNERRREGASIHEAVREAGVARFRPILLTSITTFAGLTPLLLERSVTAQFLIPMATSLGFGVLFATVISLVLVPSLYIIIDDFGGLSSALRGRAKDAARQLATGPAR